MKIRLSRRAHALLLAGGLLVLAAGAAKAISSTDFTYSQPQAGYLQLPAAVFSASRSDAQWEQDGLNIWPTGPGTACFMAPVTLPEDARMARLTFWYTRADATFYSVQFIRYRISDGAIDLLANVNPGATPSRTAHTVATATGPIRIVDNAHYSYVLSACMNSTSNTFGGARITYTYTSAGD